MPSIKAVDDGTWDRLIVIPFKGRFRNQKTEIKNYGAYLVEHCGGAILSWIIEGAQKYIRNEYKLVIPEEIQVAINEYKEDSDWAADFFNESLVFGADNSAMGSELYDTYQKYCGCSTLNVLPQTVVLPRIAQHPGVTKKRTSKGFKYYGVGVYKPAALVYLEERKRKCREAEPSEDWFDGLLEIVPCTPCTPTQR
jgi:phage/plasmid-associated DNA primase